MSMPRTSIAAVLALALASLLSAADKAPAKPVAKQDTSAVLRGTVLSPPSEKAPAGAPVAKAKVAVVVTDAQVLAQRAGESLAPARAETGEDGTFTVSGLAGKEFTVRVQ